MIIIYVGYLKTLKNFIESLKNLQRKIGEFLVGNQYKINREVSSQKVEINIIALKLAMELLGAKGSLIKLWLYFAIQNETSFEFDIKKCAEWGKDGMSRSVILDNIKTLKNLGYIAETQSGNFVFYDIPLKYRF